MRPAPWLAGPSRDETWDALRSRLGDYFASPDPPPAVTVQVRFGALDVVLEIDAGGTPLTRLHTPCVAAEGFGFVLTRRSLFSQLGALLPGRASKIGDPELDGDFVLQSTDPFKARLLLTRSLIRELIARQPVSRLQARGGLDELSAEVSWVVATPDRLRRLYDLFVETLQQWCELAQAEQWIAGPVPSPAAAVQPPAVSLAVEGGPIDVALSPTGWRLYVAKSASSTLAVVDAASRRVVATVPIGAPGRGVTVSPDGQRVYVAQPGSDQVAVVDGTSHELLASIGVARSPADVACSPDGARAYVVSSVGNAVSIVDVATHTLAATVPLPAGAYGVAVRPDGACLYVTTATDVGAGDGALLVVETAIPRVVASVAVGAWASGVALTPDGAEAYVANRRGNSVTVVDTASQRAVASIPVEPEPVGVAIHPDGEHAYVTHADGGRVSLIDTGRRAVVAHLAVGLSPYGIAVAPDGGYAYVANSGSDTISILDASAAARHRAAPPPPGVVGPSPLPSPAQPQAVLGKEGGTGAGIAAERHRFVPPNPGA